MTTPPAETLKSCGKFYAAKGSDDGFWYVFNESELSRVEMCRAPSVVIMADMFADGGGECAQTIASAPNRRTPTVIDDAAVERYQRAFMEYKWDSTQGPDSYRLMLRHALSAALSQPTQPKE